MFPTHIFISPAVIILIWMTGLHILSDIKKRLDIVDIGWGLGFILVALTTLYFGNLHSTRQFFITFLTTIWGTRLALHIYLRNRGKPEDSRYQDMRRRWGSAFHLNSFLFVFMLQGLLLLIVSTPIILTNSLPSSTNLNLLDIIGYLVWLTGFTIETFADWHLYRFKQNPDNRGRILTTGLWRYSRHPNYFGEALLWWGIFFIGLNSPWGYLGLISPIVINYLLLNVSGRPLLEKKLKTNPQYRRYIDRTSSFIPLPPKKST